MCSPRIVTIEPRRRHERSGERAAAPDTPASGGVGPSGASTSSSVDPPGGGLGVTGSSGGSGQVMIVSITLMSSSVLPSAEAVTVAALVSRCTTQFTAGPRVVREQP